MRVNWASSLALLFPTLVSATPAASLSKREIDPFGEIECRGVVPLWLMPPSLLPNEMVEPHYTGLHDFCASELYGGSSIANVGVFCMGRASMPTLAFDVINSHDQLHSPRLQLYCRSHCRCKYVDEGYGHREVPLHQVQRVFVRAPLVYNLDIYHGTGAWRDPTIPNSALELGIPLLITVDAAILQPIDHNTVIPIFVIPEIGYSMTCEGPVHPLLVPHEFQTLLANELCCTRSLGGSRLGNTGGMCVSQPDGSLQTVFLDELSHPKLQPWNFPLGISVRTICGQICRCDPLLPTQAARAEYELATADLISRLSLYGMSRGRGPGNVKASESRGDVGQIVAYMGGGTNRGNGGAPGPYANADGGVVYKGMQIVPKGGFSDANRPKDFETPWPQGRFSTIVVGDVPVQAAVAQDAFAQHGGQEEKLELQGSIQYFLSQAASLQHWSKVVWGGWGAG
ncbi:MAG: hypothetical protein M1814_001035 [Vezdaea aestivalis]|nr:MAG: hypothetical protein M1814_001035 [Vezdaea aestivalis]